jgi:phytoene dehydrogenase-like protein
VSNETVDAVVVGAGPNGLVAANLLADAGWDVLVLEANAEPGGAVRTGEVTAPGFRNDLFSAFYPFAAGSPVIRSLDLHAYGLQWAHAETVVAHPRHHRPAAVIHRRPTDTAAALEADHAGDGAAFTRLATEWDGIAEPVLAALLSPFPPVRAALRLLRATVREVR